MPYSSWIAASVPSRTFRPLKIMKMKSHIRSATFMSWVLKITVAPGRAGRGRRP